MKKNLLIPIMTLTATLLLADQCGSECPDTCTTPPTCPGPVLASGRPQVDGFGLFVTADFLYWNLYEGQTEFVLSDTNTRGISPFDGTGTHFKFKWEPGFRAGLGYNFCHDDWDTYLNFTWYKTHAHVNKTVSGDQGLIPLLGVPFSNQVDRASGNWKVQFYSLDWELGRNFFVSEYFSLRPYCGAKGASIKQRVHATYEQLATLIQSNTVHDHNDFWGVGPEAGLDGSWYFGFCSKSHFSLFGKLSGAFLWGHFDVHHTEQMVPTATFATNIHADVNHNVPTAQMLLGLGWDMNFNCDQMHFGINVAYEAQYWWNQNQIIRVTNITIPVYERREADLSLNGLTVNARFDF